MANVQRFVVMNGAGLYKKLGQWDFTDNIQEADVVGWTKKSHEKWLAYGYKLIPVTINLVPATETVND